MELVFDVAMVVVGMSWAMNGQGETDDGRAMGALEHRIYDQAAIFDPSGETPYSIQ